MLDKLAKRIIEIVSEFPSSPVVPEFIMRAKAGNLTRDENPSSHVCVYFAGFDPEARKVFIGHHKKSGLWLFNGGHIDQGETPEEALEREMGEEWGIKITLAKIGRPKLLTLTPIKHLTIKCAKHYDIWYFVPLIETEFKPDQTLLGIEFYTTGWKTIQEAKSMVTDQASLRGIAEFEKIFEQK